MKKIVNKKEVSTEGRRGYRLEYDKNKSGVSLLKSITLINNDGSEAAIGIREVIDVLFMLADGILTPKKSK